ERTHADQRVTLDRIDLEANAEVVPGGDGAARAETEVRARANRRLGDRGAAVEIDAHLVGVDADIDEPLGAVRIGLGLLRVLIVRGRVSGAPADIAAVTDEGREARE